MPIKDIVYDIAEHPEEPEEELPEAPPEPPPAYEKVVEPLASEAPKPPPPEPLPPMGKRQTIFDREPPKKSLKPKWMQQMEATGDEEWLTINQASKVCQLKRGVLKNMISFSRMPVLRSGKMILVRRSDLERWVTAIQSIFG